MLLPRKNFYIFFHIIMKFLVRFCFLMLICKSSTSEDEFLFIIKILFYFSSTIFSSVKLTNNQIIFCTAFWNKCFLLFFIQSTSIHKIFLWANRKKPFLWKLIFRHDTFWPRAGFLAGEALLVDVSWLRFLKP